MRVTFLDRAAGVPGEGRLRAFLKRTGARVDAPSGTLTVLFCGDDEIAALNRRWRGVRGPTDVLSFSGRGGAAGGPAHLGDIVISLETARRQAREARRPFAREIEILLVHGLLHLLGYDHENDDGTMLRLQERLVRAARSGVPERGRARTRRRARTA